MRSEMKRCSSCQKTRAIMTTTYTFFSFEKVNLEFNEFGKIGQKAAVILHKFQILIDHFGLPEGHNLVWLLLCPAPCRQLGLAGLGLRKSPLEFSRSSQRWCCLKWLGTTFIWGSYEVSSWEYISISYRQITNFCQQGCIKSGVSQLWLVGQYKLLFIWPTS